MTTHPGTFRPRTPADAGLPLGRFTFGQPAPVVVPRWPGFTMPQRHPDLAHYGRYDRTAADVAFGDSPAATERAAREHRWGNDKNLLSTADLVGVCQHSSDFGSFLGGKFTHQWTGPGWGEGELRLDPHAGRGIGQRVWSEVSHLTDATGQQQLFTAAQHAADGVRLGVVQVFEAKSQPLLEDRAFWAKLGAELDAVGHPRVMMTLSMYGSPVRRLAAAKAEGWHTAVLPRGKRPADWATRWAPVTDAVWGTAW